MRRGALRPWAAAVAILCALAGCDDRERVVLYSSVDDHLLREVAAEYERVSGVRVDIVGDTEATKTTGLMERLIAERGRPRGDVWWSSEPFGTIRLASEGVVEAWSAGPWRARVIVYNTKLVGEAEAPRRLAELVDARWRGRVGMARPQFGTTRGHMGALAHEWGEEALREWLEAMRDNGVRLYDGNASVVRAVASGEIAVGLTDTDDVFAGQRNGWPIEMAMESREPGGRWPSPGPLAIPTTVAVVRGGPNAARAGALASFLIGPRIERLLGESEARFWPVSAEEGVPEAWTPDLEGVAASIPAAMRACRDVLGG